MRVDLNVRDYLDRGTFVYPERVAIVDEPDAPGSLGRITYAELDARSRGLAAQLDALQIGVGERIAIVSPNSARFLIAIFGVSGSGRVLVPINFRLKPEEVQYILEHSGAALVLVDPECADLVAGVTGCEVVEMDGVADADFFAPATTEPRSWASDEDATGSINYTSGTTARPKGVQLTHRSLWLSAAMFGWHAGVNDRDVYLWTLPMFHCNGWGMSYTLTGMGVRHVVLRKVDGEDILRRIEAEGVTFLCGAPTVLAMILDAAAARRERGEDIPGRGTVRMCVAGAPPPTAVIERVGGELGWEFIQLYGLTETAPLLTINRATTEDDAVDSTERARRLSRAGAPAMGVQVRIDEEGEVQARSNHVFEGYWNQPDDTAKAHIDGWFRTGDGGYFDDAFVVIADRKKDVIISGGENVSSIEVEDALYQHPDVAEAAAIGVPDDKWGETIKGLVVLRLGAAASEAELIEHCRSRMAHFKCPTSIEIRGELARTATGKLQKFKLREPYWAGRDRKVG
jgi:acyl-CoA synthetase (AMP-forming)/AMP-acid ligase II